MRAVPGEEVNTPEGPRVGSGRHLRPHDDIRDSPLQKHFRHAVPVQVADRRKRVVWTAGGSDFQPLANVQSLRQGSDILGRHALNGRRDLGQEDIWSRSGGLRLRQGRFLTFFLSATKGRKHEEASG